MATKQSTTKDAKETDQKEQNPTTKAVKDKSTVAKSKKGLLFGLLAAAVVVVIGIAVALLCLNKTDPTDPAAKITYTKSFFIYDNGKYSLWNADGKRLTEDNYSSQSNFVGGYAYVKKDDQYGIIKEDGKMSVDFGKYGSIVTKGGLYLAQDGNTKDYSLITGSGKELAKGSDLKVYAPSVTGGFAAVETDGKIKIFSYTGTLIAEVNVADDASEPAVSSSHDFGLFFYNNQNIVFDVRDGKMVAQFDGPRYTFDSVSESRKMVILENYDDSYKYKLIANGKIYDLEETKYYGITALDDVIGYDNYSEIALLNDEYKVAKRVSTYLELKDSNNYAVENDEGNAEIYQNGEMIKDFGDNSEIASSGVMYEDYYAVESDGKYMFYKLDGSVAFNHEYQDIESLFDQYHHAIVADTEGEYFLIDASGNRIGDATAKNITSRDGGYEFKNNDSKYAIADKNGKLVTDYKYDSVYYRSYAEPRNIWTGRSGDDTYDVIDVERGTVILENVEVDSFYENYFTVKNGDNKTDYYTYTGELFYTSEK